MGAMPASQTLHVSGISSPAVVYSYPLPHSGSYGNTYPSYGYTSTPSYGSSYGHSYGYSAPTHSSTTEHNLVSNGYSAPSHSSFSNGYSIPSHSSTTGHAIVSK